MFEKIHNSATAWLILLLSLMLTIAAWYIAYDYALERADERFNFAVADAHERIERRVGEYEQILRGGVAFFNASTYVSREDWKRFVSDLQINQHFPGLQGVGWAVAFSPEDQEEVEQEVRRDGFPEFNVHPGGRRDLMTSIIYLEPFDERNQRAFGYDMFSQETRREAMEYAYQSGLPGVTGKVILLQETQRDVQPGFLMYLPVYCRGLTSTATVEDRRKSLRGFVYSPFRMNDFMMGTLGSSIPDVTFTIYDGDDLSESGLLFRSDAALTENAAKNSRKKTQKMVLGEHHWTIEYQSTPQFEKSVSTAQPKFIGVGGVAVDLLLFLVILSLGRTRKVAETRAGEIADSRRLYRGIIEGCPDGFWVTDREGVLLEVNPAYCELSGYSWDEIVGSRIGKFEAMLSEAEIEAWSCEIVNDGWKKFRTEHRRKDGRIWPVEVMASYWPHQEGRFFVFCRDITKRVESESSLVEAKLNAEAASKAKSDFLANMSHEIRTPMNAVMGLTQLAMEMDLPQEAQDFLSKSVQGSRALLGLINDILDYSKIEANRMELSLQWLRLDELLLQVEDLYQIQAEHAGLELITEIESEVPKRVLGDSLKLTQVLNNLVGNALKFSNRGSVKILLSCSKAENDKMRLNFAVSDQGIGMTESQMSVLFHPFTQGDSSITRSYGGSGLGLSISNRLVELMGGSMGVESKPKEGSTFRFSIVVEYDPESFSLVLDRTVFAKAQKFKASKSAFEGNCLKGLRVLIGEDNRTNQMIVQKLLERRGATVKMAEDGKQVLVLLDSESFDIVLLDLQMPVMGGLECAQRIRSGEADYSGIPVVAMTAAVSREDREHCVAAGMNGFVGKPFERDQLLEMILGLTR